MALTSAISKVPPGQMPRRQKEYGKPVMGAKGKSLDPISDKPVPAAVIEDLPPSLDLPGRGMEDRAGHS